METNFSAVPRQPSPHDLGIENEYAHLWNVIATSSVDSEQHHHPQESTVPMVNVNVTSVLNSNTLPPHQHPAPQQTGSPPGQKIPAGGAPVFVNRLSPASPSSPSTSSHPDHDLPVQAQALRTQHPSLQHYTRHNTAAGPGDVNEKGYIRSELGAASAYSTHDGEHALYRGQLGPGGVDEFGTQAAPAPSGDSSNSYTATTLFRESASSFSSTPSSASANSPNVQRKLTVTQTHVPPHQPHLSHSRTAAPSSPSVVLDDEDEESFLRSPNQFQPQLPQLDVVPGQYISITNLAGMGAHAANPVRMNQHPTTPRGVSHLHGPPVQHHPYHQQYMASYQAHPPRKSDSMSVSSARNENAMIVGKPLIFATMASVGGTPLPPTYPPLQQQQGAGVERRTSMAGVGAVGIHVNVNGTGGADRRYERWIPGGTNGNSSTDMTPHGFPAHARKNSLAVPPARQDSLSTPSNLFNGQPRASAASSGHAGSYGNGNGHSAVDMNHHRMANAHHQAAYHNYPQQHALSQVPLSQPPSAQPYSSSQSPPSMSSPPRPGHPLVHPLPHPPPHPVSRAPQPPTHNERGVNFQNYSPQGLPSMVALSRAARLPPPHPSLPLNGVTSQWDASAASPREESPIGSINSTSARTGYQSSPPKVQLDAAEVLGMPLDVDPFAKTEVVRVVGSRAPSPAPSGRESVKSARSAKSGKSGKNMKRLKVRAQEKGEEEEFHSAEEGDGAVGMVEGETKIELTLPAPDVEDRGERMVRPPIVAAEEGRDERLTAFLGEAYFLRALLEYLSFYDWCLLLGVSRAVRYMIVQDGALRETALERFLRTVGYSRWVWNDAPEPLSISLQDLNDYMRGVSTPTHEYARIGAVYVHSLTIHPAHRDQSLCDTVRQLSSATRAYTRVVLRLRAQAEKESSVARSRNGRASLGSRPTSRAPSPTASAASNPQANQNQPGQTSQSGSGTATSPSTFPSMSSLSSTHLPSSYGGSALQSPLVKLKRAALLQVFVPSPDGDWLSDKSVLECEAECRKGGVSHLMRVGDVIWDVAVGDEGNVGRLVWDGSYLIDLDYTYSAVGDLPKYMPTLAFPPSYFHRVIRTGTTSSNPIAHINLQPWGEEIAANLQLLQDRVRTETPQGAYHNVVRWVHRSSFVIRPPPRNAIRQPPHNHRGGTALRLPIPDSHLFVDPGWYGTVVVETEGTNEALADLQDRCGPGAFPPRPMPVKVTQAERGAKLVFRILREKSRPGEIWIRAVSPKERLL